MKGQTKGSRPWPREHVHRQIRALAERGFTGQLTLHFHEGNIYRFDTLQVHVMPRQANDHAASRPASDTE